MKPTDLASLSGAELQEFIMANENADERKLVLRHASIGGAPTAIVANQISGRRKAKSKLPLWYATRGVVYPPKLHLEQCSSEFTAQYKAALVASQISSRKRGADLTTGFGVDSFFFSRYFETWESIEPDAGLLQVALHNFSRMGATNIHGHNTTAEAFVRKAGPEFDFVFVDPSRRNNAHKVFRLADSEPNLNLLMPALFKLTKHVLVKASPLLDLNQGCAELGSVEKMIVVAVENECKELLFWCTRDFAADPTITCANLYSDASPSGTSEFFCSFSEEKNSSSLFSDPLTYLYEPNAAILKAGAFKTIGSRLGLFKLQVSTHLYTSDLLLENFPGRIFKVESLKPDPVTFHSRFAEGKVNVFTRNYPLSPDQIKKKYKLHDGGSKYLIGFSGENQKFLVAASRMR